LPACGQWASKNCGFGLFRINPNIFFL